ncbi:MAG: 4Fe-4S dicluster domain-containing protein [Planctomycetes bacterium]|nr:4Fe-4S dicluster domain-containing protein [Planctomycetota bacterium]
MSPLIREPSDVSRRRFLQVMGASMALATASGCHWDSEEILPFQRRPEGRIPGTTRRFATALECSGIAASLLVTSYDGRPIKIEGNPLHPLDRGAASARSQASVLDLYDPDHSRGLVQSFEGAHYPRTWKEFDPWFVGRMASSREKQGAGLRILAEPSSSLALAALRARFAELYPKARWIEYEPCSRRNEIEGAQLAFGQALRVQPRLEAANTLLCLDADLLGEHPAALAHARAWAVRREPNQPSLLRAWVVESSLSLTGAAADQRLALRHEQVLPFVLALEARLRGEKGDDGFGRFLELVAAELLEQRGHALVVAGPRQPAAVHALVHRINATLGNVGKTLVYIEEPRPPASGSIGELVREMEAGAVETLVVLGGNPVYDAPCELEFRRALRKVALSLHLSHYRDETSRACTWHLPRAHALESWGDAASFDGTRCTLQPLIEPIFERRTPLELVAALCGEKRNARELVRAAVAPSASEAQWTRILHDGFVEGSASEPVTAALVEFARPAPAPRAFEKELRNGELELVFAPDRRLYDGRSANNSWLQETPDSITKMTWGNAAIFAAETAAALGVEDATLVTLRVGGRELEVAATVLPGQARGSVTLHLGYGRSAAGQVGGLAQENVETVGFDAYRLRESGAPDSVSGLTVVPSGKRFELARTTDPAVTDSIGRKEMEGRVEELLREKKLSEYREDPHAEHESAHTPPLVSLWQKTDSEGARWGMAIDLSSCIGCNACSVACQAENNVPVVGREQVIRGREMHWIRIDRYFTGPESAPHVRFQPLTCQQCEAAPCEEVCPVAATMHSAEGLNDMVYNRCVGTRYCANNCPFKVRRFNYFNYHKAIEAEGAEVQRMLYNPEVTIRHRGVMEKCTFCVQRIQAAKIHAKNEGRALRDGEIVPACAQTCPTQAIVFGDLSDPQSVVSRRHADPRGYALLAELNIGPRNAYLAKITNPHPALEEHDG